MVIFNNPPKNTNKQFSESDELLAPLQTKSYECGRETKTLTCKVPGTELPLPECGKGTVNMKLYA